MTVTNENPRHVRSTRMIRSPEGREFDPKLVRRNGGVYVNSLDIADTFDKRHPDVLRSIRTLIAQSNLCARNFAHTPRMVAGPNGGAREATTYDMTRDGFTLVAMSFTGQRALAWKIKYIEAFNAMEAELSARKVPAERDYSARALDDLMESRDLLTVTYMALQAESFHDQDTIRAIASMIDLANRMLVLPQNELNAI